MKHPRGWRFWGGTGAVLGRFWSKLGGRNWKRIFEKTRVGFGRTEVSVRLDCIVFCALSFGHGPRNLGFQRFGKRLDFYDLLHLAPKEIMKIQGFAKPFKSRIPGTMPR